MSMSSMSWIWNTVCRILFISALFTVQILNIGLQNDDSWKTCWKIKCLSMGHCDRYLFQFDFSEQTVYWLPMQYFSKWQSQLQSWFQMSLRIFDGYGKKLECVAKFGLGSVSKISPGLEYLNFWALYWLSYQLPKL